MYIPLKITTDYSLLKSLIKIPNLIKFLCDNNITACGTCDENLYGVYDFYNSCINNNIKPIIGLEVKIDNLSLYLYAKDYDGYLNLIKIHTCIEKKNLSIVELKKYKSNILCIIPVASKDIYSSINFYEDIYISYHNLYEKKIAMLLSDNIIYIEDIKSLDVDDIKYLYYLDKLRKEKSGDYSLNYYENYDFIDNNKIMEVVNKLNLTLPNNKKYIPVYNKNIDSSLFLENLSKKGLYKRLNGSISDKYIKRLDYELDIIKKMGFVDYFLIVYDYVLYAKKNNILVGPGRGSAAGSLVSYSIGITDIDPLKYDLLFERFLNPSRVTMPDIDIDFDATKREEVINYVKDKYGCNKVALGLTFTTLKSKLVLREVGKIMNINNELLDSFIKCINANMTLKENLNIDNVKKYLHSYQELKDLYIVSMHLEGLRKNTSIHAAGVVISSVILDEVIPVHYENDCLITGVTMDYLENIGLLKMDFLGVKNLTTIADVIKNIGKNVLKDIDLDDSSVYEMLSSGKTEGIFQFETPLMKDLICRLKPKVFEDLVAGVALGRPGPREQADEFILRKNGKKPITYLDDSLESILKNTYGILLYQEQIIAILVKVAKYSYQEADMIRRAISKKNEKIIKDEYEKFVKRAIHNNYSEDIAKKIYNLIIKFANYGFNKSHSVAYALIAYQMSYLKVHYPQYFLIPLLSDGIDNSKFSDYLSFLKNKNIVLCKPDINKSEDNYIIEDKKLIMPLWQIKNISKEVSKEIVKNRKNGYSDIFDFAKKNKDIINESLFSSLIKAGAMDNFNLTHRQLLNNLESAIDYAKIADDDGIIKKPLIVEYEEDSMDILREDEIESYGFFISNHPSVFYNSNEYLKLNTMKEKVFKKVKCVVLIEKIKVIKTKKNEDMAFMEASDETGIGEFTVFPNTYKLLKDIKVNSLVEINGEVVKRYDKYSIVVNNIKKVGK